MTPWLETTTASLIESGLLRIGDGYRAKNSELVADGLPFARAGNINNGFQFSDADHLPSDYAIVVGEKLSQPGDIVFTSKGTVGRFGFVNKRTQQFVYSPQLCFWRSLKQNELLPRFIYYWMHGREFLEQVEALKGQTDMADYVNLADQRKMNITLPPFQEQEAMTAVLGSLDDKIDLLHHQNRTLESMAESLFRQWFVEDAEDEWEEGCLGDAVDFLDGQRIPLSKMERDKMKTGTLYPYHGAAQVMDYVNDYIFEGEYILLGEDGTVRTEEGYPVLQYATGKFWVNNHAHVLKAKPPYSDFFLWNYLRKKNIDQIVTGAVQPKINQGNLKSLSFPRFPERLVSEFNSVTGPMLARIQHNKTQAATLKALRNTLLPKLMSGEVRLQCEPVKRVAA